MPIELVRRSRPDLPRRATRIWRSLLALTWAIVLIYVSQTDAAARSLRDDVSLVDRLKALGQDSSFEARGLLWKKYFAKDGSYSGTAPQNTKLLAAIPTVEAVRLDVVVVSKPTSHDPLTFEIDKRTETSRTTGPGFCIVFSARKAVPTKFQIGHAWALFGLASKVGDVPACIGNAFGAFQLRPPDGSQERSVQGKVTGELLEGWAGNSTGREDVRFVVWIDEKDYKTALRIQEQWSAAAEYHLLDKDCTTFIGDVGRAIGLSVPDRSGLELLPWRYLLRMAEVNMPK